jgi:hypothetical protein
MPDEFTPEEQDILANSPADAPVLMDDEDDEPAADASAEEAPDGG